MRIVSLAAAILLALTFVPIAFAHQGRLDIGNRTVPTVDELLTQAGCEDSAKALVDAGFRAHFGASHDSRTIKLIAGQVRPDWLPAIEGVSFVLLTDAEARGAYASCAGCWFLGPIRHTDGLVTVEINHGNLCSTITTSYRFRLERGIPTRDWSVGSGAVVGLSDCTCTP